MNAETATLSPPDLELATMPDVSHLVTEDDTPVDNLFCEQQMRLLPHILNTSWKPGHPFVAVSNVGLYFAINGQPLVPDTMVSLGVERPADVHRKEHRCYFTWIYGKVPDIVIEIVSNREGGELDRKMSIYAFHGIPFYAVYDPEGHIQSPAFQCFEIAQRGVNATYRPLTTPDFAGTGLQLVEWEGKFEGVHATWIRWMDAQGQLLLSGEESAELERKRADEMQERADEQEERANELQERADAERRRAEMFAARLREAGIDPESLK